MFQARNNPPRKKKPFGRLYNRLLFAKVLTKVHHQPAYGTKPSMAGWSAGDWETLTGMLHDVERACYREDRNAVVVRGSKSTVNATQDASMVAAHCFQKLFQHVKSAAFLNRLLAPIRYSIEKQIGKGKTGAPRVKDASAVDEVL